MIFKDEPKFEFTDFFGLCGNSNSTKLIRRGLSVTIGGIEGTYYGEHYMHVEKCSTTGLWLTSTLSLFPSGYGILVSED